MPTRASAAGEAPAPLSSQPVHQVQVRYGLSEVCRRKRGRREQQRGYKLRPPAAPGGFLSISSFGLCSGLRNGQACVACPPHLAHDALAKLVDNFVISERLALHLREL